MQNIHLTKCESTYQQENPKLNAALSNIHLLGLFHSLDLSKYGFEPVLEPLVTELSELESNEGMKVL